MEFTFGVLAYNQERMILETLESIKYQIITFGKNINVDICLIDDASTDLTYYTADKWLKYNKELFRNIWIEKNDINLGTVINYNTIMEKISTCAFKILAADDVIASKNFFECFKNISIHEIKTYKRIDLVDSKIVINEVQLMIEFFNQKFGKTAKKWLHLMRKGCFLHTPSTIHCKKLFEDAECKHFNSKFILLEDDPSWYSMIKNVKDLTITFEDDVVILYRVHNQSVSNVVRINSPFEKDMNKLRSEYYKDSKGIEKIYFLSKLHSSIPKYLRIDKYMDKLRDLVIKGYCKLNPEYRKLYKKIKKILLYEQIYYDDLIKKVQIYKEVNKGEMYAGN